MDYQALAAKYKTPLYVYDVVKMKENMHEFKEYFHSQCFETEIAYASKAFCIKEMLRLVQNENFALDVVSLGELYTAHQVAFDISKIYFHGNNKSEEELRYAIDSHVGTIVVDHLGELESIIHLAESMKQSVSILIRLNAGIEAHTHKYIVTGHIDSKFGILYQSEDYLKMMDLLKKTSYVHFKGFHSHIGSQIFDLKAYQALIDKMILICKDFKEPLILDLGGGFGVRYIDSDQPIPFKTVCQNLIQYTEEALNRYQVKLQKLVIEPGRSIVAEAGTTLYRIGGIKKTPHRLYYFIDGGMTDNIRPALYQAEYDAFIVGKEDEFKNQMVTIAGKCCESGDIIIDHILLPMAEVNDLLVTKTTGAYGYAMSSNYNKALTPAVVFVDGKENRLVVKRQTLEELLEREI